MIEYACALSACDAREICIYVEIRGYRQRYERWRERGDAETQRQRGRKTETDRDRQPRGIEIQSKRKQRALHKEREKKNRDRRRWKDPIQVSFEPHDRRVVKKRGSNWKHQKHIVV